MNINLRRFVLSLALFTITAFSVCAQNSNGIVRINGTVITNRGEAVPNHAVQITGQDSSSTAFWTLIAGTNESGLFKIEFPLSGDSIGGRLSVATDGFFDDRHDTTLYYTGDATEFFDVLFVLPGNQQSFNCEASFVYSANPFNNKELHFENLSENYTNVFWDFGDGTTSTEINPIHSFSPGEYTVCLQINDTVNLCSDEMCANISVATPSNCVSDFSYTLLPDYVLSFDGVSQGSGAIKYFWSFGDNTSDTGQYVIHQFEATGEYEVVLTTVDELYCMNSVSKTIIVKDYIQCNADFEVVQDVDLHQRFIFSDISEGDITNRVWNLGDGSVINTALEVDHIFAPGTYQVCLQIEDTLTGCQDTECKEIYVPAYNCAADFSYLVDTMFVEFSAESNSPFSVDYQWDYGDGHTGNGQFVSHLYNEAGIYTVQLTALDSLGCSSIIAKEVLIIAQGTCHADFEAEMDTLDAIYNVSFIDLSEGDYDQLLWDFGDGSTSSEQFPEHIYEQSGNYQVCLKVFSTNPLLSCSDSICKLIEVKEFIPPETFHLAGQVFAGFFPANSADVFLIKKIGEDYFTVDTASVNEDGIFYFYSVPQGDYLLRSRPSGEFETNYVSAYYIDAFAWGNAQIIQLDHNIFTADISLIDKKYIMNGSGSIKGEIVYNMGFKDGPAQGVEIFLLSDDYLAMDGNITISDGTFEFTDVPMGAYWLYTEVVGKETQPIRILLTDNSPNAEHIQVAISEDLVTFGVQDIDHIPALSCWPNPTHEKLFIRLENTRSSDVHIQIFHTTGSLIKEYNTQVYDNLLDIDVPDLANGMYYFVLSSENLLLGKGIFIKN